MKNVKFVFDVDGTITPSRSLIDPQFKNFFDDFCSKYDVYLVTGSDRQKTIEQIGEETYNLCKRVYNCSGSEVWEQSNLVMKKTWSAPAELYTLMANWLSISNFELRTGNHVEERSGSINFSIIGRNCSTSQRLRYVDYERAFNERETIAREINENFKDISATVGGETGIDIYPKGCDKSQILSDFDKEDRVFFFGDAMGVDGNDYPLAEANVNGKNFHVKDWLETYEILARYYY